ncbi:von Willebrand factor A domain-containing protein 7 isoform X2 [Sphaeramia orbicularis]|uniref:von Willebrand factor A domain-containing protein 7 isoform X2 n=1 Tax=Sphaeramia orbicularis TaxID=375764 RepID=UPI00117F06A7|nr:von Willebrand factor A domain-containing protein 7-like isoform X2 [Sphaeramia orbicularis]
MSQTVRMVVLVVLLLLVDHTHSFQPLFSSKGNSTTHRDITQRAVLIKTAQVCRDIAAEEGWGFSLTIDDSLTVEKVQRACSSTGTSTSVLSTVRYQTSIAIMYFTNALVDVVFALSEEHHFDDETFTGGRDVITAGVFAVKSSVKQENYGAGRLVLGQVCHTLQDFYSHSNWVELGNKSPYAALIKPDQTLENLAGPSVPTCRNCTDGNCENNLLPDLQQQGLLTSGYFNLFSSEKPAGKCSHGGSFDKTSRKDPIGGISKDDTGSSHGSLHHQAADLAVNATVELLEDIRLAVGNKKFLQLMGLSQSTVLCFVIDTTGSMSDDIAEAKRVSFEIIDSKRGTQQEPSAYILVPFNDPGFGPLVMTTNADIFKDSINALTASGGGDIPEMCLSGLQLALTAAPSTSEIFVFTDAPAKDAHLKSTITALIESSKSVVTFMLTDVLASRRRRSLQGVRPRAMSQADAQLYRDLARASGGQAIEVTKDDLSKATTVIEDSSASAVVTVFQVVSNPGKPDNFSFTVDGSLKNMTAYITGKSSLTFSITSATGVTQSSSESSGPLATLTTTGNLRRLSLNAENQTGLWEISVNSNDPYSVKVIGQSSVNFIYNLVEAHEGAHGDYSLKEGRPLTGGNATILVTVTGSDTVTVKEVTLFDSSGPTEVNGTLQSVGSGSFLVTFTDVPAGDFVLRLKGEDSATSRSTHSSFQRQASTQIKPSSISVTTQTNNTSAEPGSTISVNFTVAATSNGVVNETATGTFTIQANNDRSYTSTSPSTLTIASGGKAEGTVTLTVPSSAASGTDVTLTIEAQNADATDINYAVLRFSVAAKVTDTTSPTCQVVSTTNCTSSSSACSSLQWMFVANITDGVNGTGIESVSINQGNGTLNTSTAVGMDGMNITVVSYSASCCSQSVRLAAVDNVGNVGICEGKAVTSTGGRTLTVSHWLWISVALSIIWR